VTNTHWSLHSLESRLTTKGSFSRQAGEGLFAKQQIRRSLLLFTITLPGGEQSWW
jgi:hypothetical protein